MLEKSFIFINFLFQRTSMLYSEKSEKAGRLWRKNLFVFLGERANKRIQEQIAKQAEQAARL